MPGHSYAVRQLKLTQRFDNVIISIAYSIYNMKTKIIRYRKFAKSKADEKIV